LRLSVFAVDSKCRLATQRRRLTIAVLIEVAQILADLTEPQQQAVTHVDGPLLIIAGAGSGKTRVITRRVAYLIRQGISPTAICAITFTNKAAGEMKERIGQVLGRPMRDFGRLDQYQPTICTFHSLCLRILRAYAQVIGLATNFSIYDTADQTKVLKEAIKLLDMSTTNFPPASVHAAISNAKNQLLTPEAYAVKAGGFYERQISRIYTKYQSMLQNNAALDFDDLLLRTTLALRDHPAMLAELRERFGYMMIDEYQDTNHAQYILAHALAGGHRNIAVVGDPDQSIYAWRGADIRNILDFEKDYPDAKVVRLEQNYRSTKTILALASKLIANNTQRKDKELWTENQQGEPAKVFLCQDENDEALIVVEQLKAAQKAGKNWSDMAVFYRMNALSRVMEKALFEAAVPYQIARGVEFYNRKEIKDVLAYLRVIANANDEVSLARILNVPTRGLSDATEGKLKAFAAQQGIGLWAALERIAEIAGLTPRAVKSATSFVKLIEAFRLAPSPGMPGEGRGEGSDGGPVTAVLSKDRVPPLLANLHIEPAAEAPSLALPWGTGRGDRSIQSIMERIICDSGYEAMLRKLDPDEENELPNIDQLITSAAEFDGQNPGGTLEEYLSMISLISDVDHMKGAGGAVTLMTLHAAKGLEFPLVAIIGLEEGCLPHARAREHPEQLEEERRLFFVGITRAQEQVILTKAAYRTMRGLRDRTITSPFLGELPKEHLKITDRTGIPTDDDENAAETNSAGFQRGQLVRHPQFGVGRIAEIADMGQQTRAVVEFNQVGRKTLILQYARLEAVG